MTSNWSISLISLRWTSVNRNVNTSKRGLPLVHLCRVHIAEWALAGRRCQTIPYACYATDYITEWVPRCHQVLLYDALACRSSPDPCLFELWQLSEHGFCHGGLLFFELLCVDHQAEVSIEIILLTQEQLQIGVPVSPVRFVVDVQ